MPDKKRDAQAGDAPATESVEETPRPEGEPLAGDLPAPGAESEPPLGAEQDAAAGSEPLETVTVDQELSVPPSRVAEEAPEPVAEDEIHEEETGGSLAGKLLTFLVLLLVGAALGIWGAPKLAPLLPSGLQPVADWLMPGRSDMESQVAALRSDLEGRIGGLEAQLAKQPDETAFDARIDAAVGESRSALSGEIGALEEKLAGMDGAAERQALDRLASTVDGQAAELATLKEQLSGSGQASAATAEKIDVYRAELDGLRAELGTLGDRVSGLSSRIDEISAEADRQIASAQSQVGEIQSEASRAVDAAGIESDLAQIRAAVADGDPFADALERMAGRDGVTVPDTLHAVAGSGVATLAELRNAFPDAAHAAIRSSIQASAGEGFLARSGAFLRAQVASRSLKPQEGVGSDAVLSRMQARLDENDLDGALTEADSLPTEAAVAMADWLDAARQRAGAVDGLAALAASLPATN